MKKILLYISVLLAFASCKEETLNQDDKISLSSEEAVFDAEAGKVQVLVTSSDKWTMSPEENYKWVSYDRNEGVDGDIVTFKVDKNEGEAPLSGRFVFSVGKATATFTICSNPADIPSIELKSDSLVIYSHELHKNNDILVFAEGRSYQDFEVTVSEGADSWLHFSAVIAGETESDGVVKYTVDALDGLEDREGTLTVSMPGTKAPVEVKVIQRAEHILSVDGFFGAPMKGGIVEVAVTSNVEYAISISDEGTEWITYKEKKGDIECFEVAPLESGRRSAKVILTQTDAEDGEEPLVTQFDIAQQNSVISWAARMDGNRLFPKWEGENPGQLNNFTWEMLFKVDAFDKPLSASIMTLMGIEGHFLLRFGDINNLPNHIQIATDADELEHNYNVGYDVLPEKWYHLAVTFDYGKVTVYLNGEDVGYKEFYRFFDVVNSPMWSYEPDGNRCMWMGYSFDTSRDFHGLMTEIRIWNKTLTKEEINAEGHFYEVDPHSEGLFSYWKFTKGEGDTVEDATGNGNLLYGETNVRGQVDGDYNINKGDAGIQFERVMLPE